MAFQNGPQLGATFTPGGSDDFYMPEVISPSPQRFVEHPFSSNLRELEPFPGRAQNPE